MHFYTYLFAYKKNIKYFTKKDKKTLIFHYQVVDIWLVVFYVLNMKDKARKYLYVN